MALKAKPAPARVAVFGANARIGGAVAAAISERAPQVAMTLITRTAGAGDQLAADFPKARIAVANYYDLPSLVDALAGADGIFVVTPDFLDEDEAMTNLIHAVQSHGQARHIVRLLADPPGMTIERIPAALQSFGSGPAIQHMRARRVLEVSGLPITYMNIAAYFMQNFTMHLGASIRSHRVLTIPRDRRMAFIDAADVGACAAALLLSENPRHIDQIYHLDNGYDVMHFSEVAELMSKVFGESIGYDGSDESYRALSGPNIIARFKRPDAIDYFLNYSQFEQDNETVWRKTDVVEFLTGRPAVRLGDFLGRHREAILGSSD